jgi:HlyD family secretion protein
MTQPTSAVPQANPSMEAHAALALDANGNGNLDGKRPSKIPSRERKKGRSTLWLALGILGIVGLIVGVFIYWQSIARASFSDPTWTVKKQKLILSIVERGSLESANNAEFACRVKAKTQSGVATTIKWLVDDGSLVKKGDKLIVLDDSTLQDNLTTELIKLNDNEAAFIKADQDLKIALIDNENKIKLAMTDYMIARLSLEKYIGLNWEDSPSAIAGAISLLSSGFHNRSLTASSLLLASTKSEGDYHAKLQDTLGKIELAQGDRDAWQERAAWSRRMWKLGFMSKTQSDGDQSRLESADYSLRKLETDLHILKNYERTVTVADLRSKLGDKYRSLLKAYIEADATKATKESDQRTKKSTYEQQQNKIKDIREEITKCIMYAPKDGLAVYYIPESTRGGFGKQALVAVGENVSEGQKLMQIPDLMHMQVNTRVHEAMVSQVRPGQKAQVRVDAHPGRVLKGHVTMVKTVPSAQDWLSADVRVYQTNVAIDDNIEELDLKPGLSAEVTIFADEASGEVLAIPIQSVVGNIQMGQKRKCFVVGDDGQPRPRDIVVGMNNDTVVEVQEGLKEGEVVVMNPLPLLTGENSKLKPGVPQVREQSEDSGGAGRGKKGGKGGKKGGGFKGPGGGFNGPGGPGGGKFGNGPGGGGGDWKKKQEEFQKKMQSATPEQRRELINGLPEQIRDQVRDNYRAKGMKIAD